MDAAQPHIEVRGLTMAYGSRVIQKDLDFTVNRGDIFVIMRGSGCGNSGYHWNRRFATACAGAGASPTRAAACSAR